MQGFLLTNGKKHFVLITDKINITDAIAKKFIIKMLECKNSGYELINKCINDRYILNETKRRIKKCEYEKVTTDTISYFKIYDKNFYIGIPYNEKDTLIIFD